MTTPSGPAEQYFRTVADVDPARANALVLEMLDEGTSVEQITTGVLAPAQVRVGELWEQGRWTVADEHAATAVTETALSALVTAALPRRTLHSRHVAVACPEGEWHTLPARMAAAIGSTGDSRVTVLGPSMPADHLGRRLAAGDVDVLALSCTMPTNLLGAARCVQAAHEAGVPVLAGGRAFGRTPRRAHAIGADAWAAHPTALTDSTPTLAHRATVVPAEAVLLDMVDDSTVTVAYERLVAAWPPLQGLEPWRQDRTREDLRWMARFTGAAVVADDPTVLDELLCSLCTRTHGPIPIEVTATAAHIVSDTVEPFAAKGAELLRQATDRMLSRVPG